MAFAAADPLGRPDVLEGIPSATQDLVDVLVRAEDRLFGRLDRGKKEK